MKKSIFVLLVLLAVLIVTCVYQKTYEIYSTSPQELTLIERKSTPQSTATTTAVEKKEEKASTVPVAAAPIATKPVKVTPVPAVKAEPQVKVVPDNKPVVKAEKTVIKEVKREAVPSTKNSTPAPKVPTVLTEEVNAPKNTVSEKTASVSSDKKTPVTEKSGEEEIVDYVMWAMKNRDIAMKNRDQVAARIHELITKALNDRKIALDERKVVLDERSKNEIELLKLQTEQIDARDASYESVTNPKTTNQGEK